MKWVKYKICCNEEKEIYITKKLQYSVSNVIIAMNESYDGNYEVVEDEKHSDEYFEKQPLSVELGGTGCKTEEEVLAKFGIAPTYEDSSYPGCYYRLTEDSKKEWINPPMIEGKTYRTVERYNGKPVYVAKFSANKISSQEVEMFAGSGFNPGWVLSTNEVKEFILIDTNSKYTEDAEFDSVGGILTVDALKRFGDTFSWQFVNKRAFTFSFYKNDVKEKRDLVLFVKAIAYE